MPAPAVPAAFTSGDDTGSAVWSDRPRARFTVLDISEYYGPDSGGVRTYLHEKARYVAARPWLRQVVVLPGAGDTVRTADGVRVYRVRSPRIPFQETYRVLSGVAAVRRIIERERPDLIEVGSAYGAPWVARRATRGSAIPLVWYFHAHLPRIVAPLGKDDRVLARGGARLAERYVRAIASRMDRVYVATDAVKRDLERLGIRTTERIPLGVDINTFRPGRRAARYATLAHYQLPDAPIVLFAGRFTREKQLLAAVRAWTQARTVDATLVLVGAGPQAESLHAAAGARVRIVPFEQDRERLADLYAAADLYLAPGPAETFGLSAHEAMASGTPVLSVAAGAVAEAVERAGCGGIWPLGDGAAMATMVDRLLPVPEVQRHAARRYVEREHAWPVVFDRLFTAHEALVAAQ
jgi:alpha-1,6-mannosyltransferase